MAEGFHHFLAGLRPRVTALAEALHRHRARFRIPLLLLAIGVFVGGVAISVHQLSLDPDQLRLGPLAALALVVAPLAIAYSAVNMSLMGKAIGVPIGFVSGVRISVFAQVAELLPIPGGAIVRTAALMKGGGGGLQSTGIVLAFACLWIAWAAAGGGLALWSHDQLGQALLVGGLLAMLAITYWLWTNYGWTIALAANGLRALGLCLVATNLSLAYHALSIAVEFRDTIGLTFGVVLGSAASIVPAGLGIGESISALLAIPLNVDPASAFLAVAMIRIIGFGLNMLIACSYILMDKNPSAS